MASIVGGMLGMVLTMLFPFQWIVNAGHASKASFAAGIVVAALGVGLGAATGVRLTLQLEAKR